MKVSGDTIFSSLRVFLAPIVAAGWHPAPLRGVLDASIGKSLISEDGGTGFLRSAAEESGHPGLVSLAIQLGFVGRGVQVQTLLKSLAQTFADEFIAQAETHAEKLGSSLGVTPFGGASRWWRSSTSCRS